jgi:hypothetical protein
MSNRYVYITTFLFGGSVGAFLSTFNDTTYWRAALGGLMASTAVLAFHAAALAATQGTEPQKPKATTASIRKLNEPKP